MRGLQSILSLFRNEFNKFNNTRAQMLDFIYHMTLSLLRNLISAVKRFNFVIMYATLLWTSYNVSTTSGSSILLHDVISLPDSTSCDKNKCNF